MRVVGGIGGGGTGVGGTGVGGVRVVGGTGVGGTGVGGTGVGTGVEQPLSANFVKMPVVASHQIFLLFMSRSIPPAWSVEFARW